MRAMRTLAHRMSIKTAGTPRTVRRTATRTTATWTLRRTVPMAAMAAMATEGRAQSKSKSATDWTTTATAGWTRGILAEG